MFRELLVIESTRLSMASCLIDLNNSIIEIKGHELAARWVRRPSNDPLISIHGAASLDREVWKTVFVSLMWYWI